ncbi:MAG: NAD(P)H-dependent oxidoreductase [Bacteroidetes bacterium]|nr:NAD(P)H-dependent oxidoreductase [Bacteroidota bacterium]
MKKIIVISASVRAGRQSHKVALYFKNYIEENQLGIAEILDLKEFGFPLFEERLSALIDPPSNVVEFAQKIKSSDGVIIVTPEYNGGYPASLKNVIDLLYKEWFHKPVAISTVSEGVFGGSQVITSLQFALWKIKALTVTATFPVPRIRESFSEAGIPIEKDAINKRASEFLKELFWFIEATGKMQ